MNSYNRNVEVTLMAYLKNSEKKKKLSKGFIKIILINEIMNKVNSYIRQLKSSVKTQKSLDSLDARNDEKAYAANVGVSHFHFLGLMVILENK